MCPHYACVSSCHSNPIRSGGNKIPVPSQDVGVNVLFWFHTDDQGSALRLSQNSIFFFGDIAAYNKINDTPVSPVVRNITAQPSISEIVPCARELDFLDKIDPYLLIGHNRTIYSYDKVLRGHSDIILEGYLILT